MKTEGSGPVFRKAERGDTPRILGFIRQLAEYERLSSSVVATEEMLEKWLFDRRSAEVLFVEEDGVPVGFALYFYNFSTFEGRPGLYLEDLFVVPEHRGKGYGKGLFLHLAQIARREGCGRMEWVCLDWNARSIAFYKSLGAASQEDWTLYRLTADQLAGLAGTS